MAMLFRKLRTRGLTKTQKKFNKKASQFRVIVENALAGVKRSRCITDLCRNKSQALKDQSDVTILRIVEFIPEGSIKILWESKFLSN